MRVRQHGQSLRLRIDEAELARLLEGGTLENATRWPDGRVERQRLALAAEAGWRRAGDGWRLELGEAAVRDFAARLPSRNGLEFELGAGPGALAVVFDVDVRDSARRLRAQRKGHLGQR